MSSWLVTLIGLLLGFIIGLFFGRKNYESCRGQILKLKDEIRKRKTENLTTKHKIEDLEKVAHRPGKSEATVENVPLKGISEAELEAAAPDVALQAPDVDIDAATADVSLKAPEVELESTVPDVALQAPDVDIDAATADVSLKAPEAELEAVASDVALQAPDVDIDAATADVSLKAPEAELEATVPDVATRTAGINALNSDDEQANVSACPQKLARIKGIGRVYEEKLYEAGIGTFWQVATTTDTELGNIFGIKDFQAVDLSAIKQGAMQLAEATGTVGKVWSGASPDDLETLPGIGKTYEARLYDAGICTWAKLATLSSEALAAILKAPKWNQPDYEAWIAFAREHL